MAFNPFHKFRKHQKVIFGALTIFCMFSFVACSGLQGGGDLATWLQGLVGNLMGKGQGSEVATIEGKKVTYVELRDLQRQRQLANSFMIAATNFAMNNIAQELRPPTGAQPDFRQQFEFETKLRNDRAFQRLNSRMMDPRTGQPDPRRPYFGGSYDADGLLEFLVWKKQADALGIEITWEGDEGIEKHFNRLTENRVARRADRAIVESHLRQEFGRIGPDVLNEALRQEFRVQLAQIAMLGLSTNNVTRVPDPVTPQDFWEWYKDKRTEISVDLLPVKVEDFLAQVKEQPTEKDLLELYKKGKDREFFPELQEPAFMQSRRIQIEWVSSKPDSPFVQERVAELRKVVPYLQMFAAAAPTSPLSGLVEAAELAHPPTFDFLLHQHYEREKSQRYRLASYLVPWAYQETYPMHQHNVYSPFNIAAIVGQGMGANVGLDGAAFSMLTTQYAGATYRELQDRTAHGCTWLLTSNVSPFTAVAIGAYLRPANDYLPLEAAKTTIEDSLQKQMRDGLMTHGLRTVAQELDKLAKTSEKRSEKVQEYLTKAIKEHGLQAGKTTAPRDRYKNSVAEDAGLKALKDAYLRLPTEVRNSRSEFGNMFFSPQKPYELDSFEDRDSEGRVTREVFLFWKTDDQQPKVVPFENPDVRKEVEYYWKFDKARALAKKDAEQLAIKAREMKGDDRQLEDFAATLKKPLIKLSPLARLMRKPSSRVEIANTYFQPIGYSRMLQLDPRFRGMSADIPELKVPNAGIEFPTKLLALLDKEKGDTLVVADVPVGTYYVAVLVAKQPPPLDGFFQTYRQSSSAAISKDPLLMNFERERQEKYVKDFSERLKEDFKLVKDEEKLKDFKGDRDSGGGGPMDQ